jgi:hypothetical protein
MTDFIIGVEKLIDTCWSRDRFANQGLGQDNVTAVLVEFKKDIP